VGGVRGSPCHHLSRDPRRTREGNVVVSIVINNFNYAEFVGEAIESALGQRGTATEVIVVDDGSTDDSPDLIRRYEPHVRTVLKQNGGQASAFNAGFLASTGDIVLFLDADDALLPDTAARVAKTFFERPDAAKIHYRLRVVDERGLPTGRLIPPAGVALASGDVRARILHSPHDVPHPPTSGNAFARRVLERVLPMPEPPFTRLADVYLVNVVSLFGPVLALEDTGGLYRVHGRNTHYRAGLDLDALRQTITASAVTEQHLAALARSAGFPASAIRPSAGSVTDLAQRLVSYRLAPDLHPIHSDRRLGLAARGIRCSVRRSDAAVTRRLLYAAWFGATALAPRRLVRPLATGLLGAWQRGSVLRWPPRS
jgi:glycosyltransferase involved in cell wall biosynthesis